MTDVPPTVRARALRLTSYLVAAGVLWTSALGASFAWNVHRAHHAFLELSIGQARATFQKDLAYRRWNATQGGVYVAASEGTPPNPWLAGVPGRDLETLDGRHLTLVNPSYMTRQVHELAAAGSGIQGHITSLRPIRPENAPDAWERRALQRLERGEAEVVEVTDLDGGDRLRFMGRLLTEEACLRCHARQGYRVGDVRGGISVSVPLAPFVEAERAQALALAGWHALLWGLGVAGLVVGGRRLSARVAEREAALTALHEAERQLGRSRRLEAVGQLAGGVAHELNNLLVPILSHASVALEDAPPGGDLRQDLGEVVGAAKRARDLVRRLLAFARRQPLEVAPLDLSEVVAGFLPMVRDLVGRRVEVEASLAAGLPAVEADRGQLETVLIALAANAREAMPGGGTLHLETAARQLDAAAARPLELQAGAHVALAVRDGGAGMPPEVLARVFEPFFTTREAGQGAGLGLSSVHGVVRQHGGAVTVESAPGQGTTVRILLPASGRRAACAYAPAPPSASSSAADRSQSA